MNKRQIERVQKVEAERFKNMSIADKAKARYEMQFIADGQWFIFDKIAKIAVGNVNDNGEQFIVHGNNGGEHQLVGKYDNFQTILAAFYRWKGWGA